MMRPRPYIDKYERPEMKNTKFIGINRPIGHLRQKIVHHAQVRRRQKESYCIVSIPPLYQCVLNDRVNLVARPKTYGKLEGIYAMKDSDSDKFRYVKPYSNRHMTFSASKDGSEHINAEYDPNQGDTDVNRPLHFRVLMRRGKP